MPKKLILTILLAFATALAASAQWDFVNAKDLTIVGKLFPDTDDQYKGISSMLLLEEVRKHLDEEGYVVNNIDATIIAQRPKLRPFIEQMEDAIAKTLQIAKDQVNIKATTEEGLGFTGSEEGISAQAICSLYGIYEISSAVPMNSGGCGGCGGCKRE